MNPGRRQLALGLGAAAVAAGAGVLRARAQGAPVRERPAEPQPRDEVRPRRLVLRNLHTDESLEVEYWRDGSYLPEALGALEQHLRDFRTGERHAMDPALFDILDAVAARLETAPEFGVISGYRSPYTNAMLHERSSGVAARSLHLEGRAIDVRLARIDCADLANAGLALARGGVGYYRHSEFVHLDTGRVRTWRG